MSSITKGRRSRGKRLLGLGTLVRISPVYEGEDTKRACCIAFEHSLTMNEHLSNVTAEYEAPTIVHSTITIDGYGGCAVLPVEKKTSSIN